ncbi:MAG: hypothetical protein HZA49_04595 [Planctomycetes bacterium]|nr:hypothetical protein [Planctomycetota bacterium]
MNTNDTLPPLDEFTPARPEPPSREGNDASLLDEQGKRGLWNQILAQIRILHPVKVYPYIKEGQFISVDNEEIVIGFPKIYNFHRSRLEDVNVKEEVERIAAKVSGLKISVVLVTVGGNGSDGEISREPLIPIGESAEITAKTASVSSNQADKKTGGISANPKSTSCLAGDDERRLREKVLQDERVRKILEVFEGKLVKVKKS